LGDIIRFVFEDANANPTLVPGLNSALLVVRTDAQAYLSTIAGVINGSTANANTFAPVAIPEPSAAVLGITCGAVLLTWVSRRRMN
jgi:hypothetical protein